ncbi:MAG TPA: tricarboxylic transporter, partial [Clostridiaceae bacterium]|nr:tricarboxylic transporter [Clostridiaceae bacterium]
GSDIFTRMISDIMATEDIVDSTFVVTNKTDGGGEIGRNEVANLKGDKANNTLLTFNSGDLMPMVQNTKNRAANFKILAIMAVDKQLIFKGESTKYETFEEAIEAAKNGESVVIGGSKGDDIATYEAMIEEIGVSKDNMKFITHDSTGDAITAALGGHVEFVLSKPAAATQYVEAGSLIPVLALSNERYTGNLESAPTLSEIGDYENVEIPVWRGVAAPAEMSDAAVAYWTEALEKVSGTDKWTNDYIEKNKLIPEYKNSADATSYVVQYEKDFMEANGLK